LAKAPRFDEVPEFDKSKNGLFPVHVHIDQRGFVWVNLESSETPSVSWESRFAGSDTRDRLAEFNMDEYVFDHAWSMEGKYNWKACVDNYNEVCVPQPAFLFLRCDAIRIEPKGRGTKKQNKKQKIAPETP
jgi:phenylpropionate dioxygenase-like ring-hydroxylating dioxygenase large terminal subunit